MKPKQKSMLNLKAEIKTINWLAQSPDWNPLEKLWSLLKSNFSGIEWDSLLDLSS